MNHDAPRRQRWTILEIGLLLLGLVVIAPCWLALLNSFKTLPEIVQSPLAMPERLRWDNYRYLFTEMRLAVPMFNSLLMCVAVIGALIGIGSMAAYAITRLPLPGATMLRVLFLAGLTIPFQIIMIPLLKEFRWLGLHTTYLALWLHYVSWGLPLCIFIYSMFMVSIPKELEEAATIDGCGAWRTFWQVVFPLLRPCTVSIIIFWGLWIWNDFLQAFIIMGNVKGQLAFVQLQRFFTDQYVKDWGRLFAAAVVLAAPITILYVALQRHFVKGLTAGAIK
jgi:raffinose/stachyose/melibiose transport system permease protein